METNIKNMGKLQREAFAFISKIDGWHSFDKNTKHIIIALEKRNLVDVNIQTNQYRLR
jgi:hypothetical protein